MKITTGNGSYLFILTYYTCSFIIGSDGKNKKYLLCLGTGGFAATLDGIRIVDGNRIPVAIKHVAMDRRAAEMFEKYEMRGIESLTGRNHSSLVKFIGYFKGEDGDGRVRMNFVFERCPTAVPYLLEAITTNKGFIVPSDDYATIDNGKNIGCDLLSNPLRTPPMDILEAKFIIRQILEALLYLHSSTPPIIHRDVKPGNILIWSSIPKPSPSSSSSSKILHFMDVKLTDYGTVRRMDTRDLTVGQGTKSFMAPEVDIQTGTRNAKPIGTYDTSVDIFSVGATFFYLITGQTPDGNTRKPWYQRFGSDVMLSGIRDNNNGRIQAKVPTESVIGLDIQDGVSLFDRAALAQNKKPKSARRHISNDLASRFDRSTSTSNNNSGTKSPSTPRSSSMANMGNLSNTLPSFSLTLDNNNNNTSLDNSNIINKLESLDLGNSNGKSSPKSVVLSPSKPSSSSLSRQVSNVTVSLLDYYFPIQSIQRQFLEGLVYNIPNNINNNTNTSTTNTTTTTSTPVRWTAGEALAWLDTNWKTEMDELKF